MLFHSTHACKVLGGLSCPKWSLAALAVDLCFEMNKEEPTAFSLLLGQLGNIRQLATRRFCTLTYHPGARSLPTACSNMIMHTDDSSLQQDALSWLLLGFATMPSCRVSEQHFCQHVFAPKLFSCLT